jgi:hypothetical protein
MNAPAPVVRTRQVRGATVEERLYAYPNGWALAARRGGVLDLAGPDSWEIAVLRPDAVMHGRSVGFVSDDDLAGAAETMAAACSVRSA